MDGIKEESWQANEQEHDIPVEPGRIVATVSAAGNTSTLNEASVAFQTTGRVAKVHVQVGDRVEKGQVLMELDTTDLQLALQSAQASLAGAQASYDDAASKNSQNPQQLVAAKATLDKAQAAVAQAQAAYDRIGGSSNPQIGMTSQARILQQATDDYNSALANYKIAAAGINDSALRQAQATLDQAKVAVQQAQSNLDKTKIVAPFDGAVAAVNYNVGDTVGGGSAGSTVGTSAAVTVVNTATLQVNAALSEIDVVKVKPGQTAQLSLDALPGNTYTATVTEVGPVGAVTQGVVNYPVTLTVPNGGGEIKPGMTANLNIVVAQQDNVLVVPTRAIHTQGNPKNVTVLYKGQQITAPVQTGLSNDQSIVVTSGLRVGDQVILNATTTSQPRTPNFGPGGGFRFGG